MQHTQVMDLLSAYVERELDGDAQRQVEAHLGDCQSCRGELESFQQTISLVAGMPRMMAPPDFVRRVQQRVRKRTHGRHFGIRAAATRVPFEVVSFALIVMVLAMYVIMLLNGPVPARGTTAAPVAPAAPTAPAAPAAPARSVSE